jgi:catechol 2,3-dioxygenase-like lactoylglutathione lyase family enzyme
MTSHRSKVRLTPFIAVRDVPAASDWYQQLLGCSSDMDPTHPHRREYDRILSDGDIVLQLHSWDEEEHEFLPSLAGPDSARHGHGVVLEFVVSDYVEAVERARSLSPELLGEDAFPDGTRAFSLRDLDGYLVVLAGPPPGI